MLLASSGFFEGRLTVTSEDQRSGSRPHGATDRAPSLWAPFWAPRGSRRCGGCRMGTAPPQPLPGPRPLPPPPHRARAPRTPGPAPSSPGPVHPRPGERTPDLPARGARGAAREQARSRGPRALGSAGRRRLAVLGPARSAGGSGSRCSSSSSSGPGARGARGGLGFGASSCCCPPAARRSRLGLGLGLRDAGVVGLRRSLPRAAPLWGAPGSRGAGATGSGRARAAAGWAQGRRAGALLRARTRVRAPRRGLSPWLPAGGRAGGRLAPPLRAAVTARRAPSPPPPAPGPAPAPPPARRPPGCPPG